MLAQSRLEAPHNPAESQKDVLATALQPIVAFVVLGSILTRMSTYSHLQEQLFISTFADGLSIPFFSAGRHTLTISRSLVDQPDWLLGVRRAPLREDPERSQQGATSSRKGEPPRLDTSMQAAENNT
jgi:sodium/hydrogen antiporter